ncbi:hypothetical protein L226DRAFT_572471 [Lentinus tigrinus ALCF2SS1-7]|uniref:Uncharacterized protein n=1 Tax=Lentinus tigrinus ALCF2SS1-6 TaxID=1328759 RepID=A0A5C2S762_9APHY|nr:hypothetical protein L227DRAFT_612303 [Lentinus tigrinus ALCF2SS1-6]RPD73417.1 hypothetical protein L226DRAFT_572471 [Lentinus tigrinus ALCF2SS1-7]
MQAPTLYYVHDPASDILPHSARSHTYSTYPPPPSVFLGGDVITSLYMSRIRNTSPDDSSVSTSTPSPAASTLSFAPSPLDETTPSYATPFNNVPSAHEAVPYIFHDWEQLCGPAHHRTSPTAVLHCDVLEMGSLTGNSNSLVAPAPYVQGGDNAAMPPWLAPYTLPTLSTETGTARNPHLATVPSMYSTRSSLVPDVSREHAEQWPFVDVVPPNMGSDMFTQSASNTVFDEGYWAVPLATVTRTHIGIVTHASGLEHQYEPDLRFTIPSDVTPRDFIFPQSSDLRGVFANEVSYPESLSPRMSADTSRTMEWLPSVMPLTHLTEAIFDHRDILGDFELLPSAQAKGARVDDGCATSLGISGDPVQYSP